MVRLSSSSCTSFTEVDVSDQELGVRTPTRQDAAVTVTASHVRPRKFGQTNRPVEPVKRRLRVVPSVTKISSLCEQLMHPACASSEPGHGFLLSPRSISCPRVEKRDYKMGHGPRTSSVVGKISMRMESEPCSSHNELRAGTSSALQVHAREANDLRSVAAR